MISKEDLLSLSSHFVNWSSVAINSLLLFIGGLTLNQWGIALGIFGGIVTTAVNVWAKRRLVKIAERTGSVNV